MEIDLREKTFISYSHVQKIGKLSSVAPGEQCDDTLRS